MKQHAMQTAITLYQNGTLDLQTAARQAGVSVDRLRRAVEGIPEMEPSPSTEADRVPLQAD